MKKRRNFHKCWIGAAVVALSLLSGAYTWKKPVDPLAAAREMGTGINIGNSLDVERVRQYIPNAGIEDFERFWGNPPITPQLIKAIRDKGFSTVRIPVSWGEHMGEDGTVDPEWMKRVEQVVSEALGEGLYVILDTHHESWLVPTPECEAESTWRLTNLWGQIAEHFANYGDRLLFEPLNEPRLKNSSLEWTAGTDEMRAVINRMYEAVVSRVRSCGGNNETRWLLLEAYGNSNMEEALRGLCLPDDPYLMVSVHAYLPYSFALAEGGTAAWDRNRPEDIREINELLNRIDTLFLQKGIPVVITEYGCNDRQNPEARKAWVSYWSEQAGKMGVPLIWWDNGKESQIIDRESLVWTQEGLVQAMME